MCSSVLRSLASSQTQPNQPTNNGLGLTHTREQSFCKQQMQTWLGLYHIYIYTINCQCVHSLFDTLCLLEQKTDEFNKTMKLTCPLSVHPQSKQIEFETLVAASGERSYRTKGQHSVLHPNNLSLSLSLSLSSDYWSLMSDCNKFSSPSPQRLAFS
jgi:hypothetical protein